jgi:uncharacterized membrane protein YoaK (UPF0700 family)
LGNDADLIRTRDRHDAKAIQSVKRDKILVIATLSFVAGFVDTAGFIALFGLFTAYVTGNLALLAAEIVREGKKIPTRIVIIPVFILTVAGTTLYIRHHAQRGHNLLRRALAFQAVLLLAALVVAVALGAPRYPEGATMLIIGPLMVAAMAVQNAATRLVLRIGMPTTLMTLNITQLTIDLVDLWRGMAGHDERIEIRDRVATRASAVASFLAGAAAGALGFYLLSFWCLAVPLFALAALVWSDATRLVPSGPTPPISAPRACPGKVETGFPKRTCD